MRTYIDHGDTISIDGMNIPKTGGHRLYIEFLVLQAAEEAELVQPAGPTLEEAKGAKQSEITNGAQAAMAPLAAQYCGLEMQTWDQQAQEAHAIQTDFSAPAPLVRAMAAARGMDVLTLAGRIVANEGAWKAVSGAIIGQRMAYQDRLDAAQDVCAVQAVVVAYVLPG